MLSCSRITFHPKRAVGYVQEIKLDISTTKVHTAIGFNKL